MRVMKTFKRKNVTEKGKVRKASLKLDIRV